MLNAAIIGNIRSFLERVQLTGKEVPAFNQVMMALAVEENAGRPVVGSVKNVPASAPASPPAEEMGQAPEVG
jgi:hypothetical protein